MEFIQLSPEYTLSEIIPLKKWMGKSLLQLKLRSEYRINVIDIRAGETINASPSADDVIREGDAMIVMDPVSSIRELERRS